MGCCSEKFLKVDRTDEKQKLRQNYAVIAKKQTPYHALYLHSCRHVRLEIGTDRDGCKDD